MTDTPNTDQPLDLDAIEARVAECADCAVHDDWIEMANEDRLALLAEVRKLRDAPANPDEGKIWSAIKKGLTMGHTSMRNICNAQTFEMASAHEDELARAITERVVAALGDPS